MGADYGMCFLVENKDRLYEYIRNNGELGKNDCSLIFNLDHSLLKYYQGWYEYQINDCFKKWNREQYNRIDAYTAHMVGMDDLEEMSEGTTYNGEIISGNRFKMGGFDIYEKQVGERALIQLVAVTSDMSYAIKESNAVHQWLVDCSKYANAKLAYMDCEHEGIRILWFNNRFIDIQIENYLLEQLKSNEVLDMIKLISEIQNTF